MLMRMGIRSGTGSRGDFGFAGYFHHAATGLDFAEHRVYSPQYGRWLTRDPIGVAGGMNLYRYADDDPASLSDPSGNCPACVGAAVGFCGGAVAGGLYYAASASTGLSWGQFAQGALSTAGAWGAAGAAAGTGGALAGAFVGGGTLASALGLSDGVASVAGIGALGSELVSPGGKLDQMLDAISQNFGTVSPTNAMQALTVIQQAAKQVNLEPGYPTFNADGSILLQNAGGVITTLGSDGSILVQRGTDNLLHLCH